MYNAFAAAVDNNNGSQTTAATPRMTHDGLILYQHCDAHIKKDIRNVIEMTYAKLKFGNGDIRTSSVLRQSIDAYPHLFTVVRLTRHIVETIIIDYIRKTNFVSSSSSDPQQPQKRGPKQHPRPVGVVDSNIKLRFVSDAVKQLACDLVHAQVKAHVPLSVPLASRLFNAVFQANGFDWKPQKSWVLSTLKEIGLSPRKVTQQSRKLPTNWEELGKAFVLRVADVVNSFNITDDFIVNFDETGLLLFHINNKTWGVRGAKQCPGRGKDDKRQRTVIPCIAASGAVVSCTTVWQGQTKGCLPSKELQETYPNVFHDFSSTHWSTPAVIFDKILRIFKFYIIPKCVERGQIPSETYWLLIMDVYSSHIDKVMLETLRRLLPTLIILFVPAGCTPFAQMCDVEYNFWFKSFVSNHVRNYMQECVLQQLSTGVAAEEIVIQTDLMALKEIFTQAISLAQSNAPVEMVKRSFDKCGVAGTEFLFSNIRSSFMVQYLIDNPRYHWNSINCGSNSNKLSRYAGVIGSSNVLEVLQEPIPSNFSLDSSVEVPDDFALMEDDAQD